MRLVITQEPDGAWCQPYGETSAEWSALEAAAHRGERTCGLGVEAIEQLTALAAAILLRLVELKETLKQAVVTACTERRTPLGEEVLTSTATLLADLADRGALLGRRPE